jgi:hypothetical protein
LFDSDPPPFKKQITGGSQFGYQKGKRRLSSTKPQIPVLHSWYPDLASLVDSGLHSFGLGSRAFSLAQDALRPSVFCEKIMLDVHCELPACGACSLFLNEERKELSFVHLSMVFPNL